MSIYKRVPYWWKKYEIDPVTGVAPRKPASTGIYVDGGSAAQTKQNRLDALAQYQADCVDLRRGVALPTSKPAIRVKDYAAWWLKTYAVHHKGYDTEVSTVNIIVADLGDLYLTDLTAPRIAEWRTEKTKTVKARTADRYIDVLRPMLGDATDYLDSNPISGRNLMGKRKWKQLEWEDTESRFFSRDEFARFIAAIDDADDILDTPKNEGLALAYTAVTTLLRRGSLLRLTWPYLRASSVAYPFPHFVPLDAKVTIKYSPVTAAASQYLDELPRDTPHKIIFASHYRNADTDPKRRLGSAENHVTRWFNEVCSRAQLPHTRAQQGLTFHSFRHTGATWALEKSHGDVKAVMELGGWKSAQLFLDTYCHTKAASVAAVAESLFPMVFPRAAQKAAQA